jgi:hypothetical protein
MREPGMHDPSIGDAALETFRRDGVLILKRFYDPARDIAPIKEGIRRIVALLARKYGVDAPSATPDEAMTRGYLALIRANRAWGGEVYDAIKQIPAFARLVSAPDNERLFARLRPGSVPGVAAGGHGIRIDNPGEARFRAPWHQEFPAQLRSLDGVVFWSPLLPMTPDMGPVEMAAGSHLEGMVPVRKEASGPRDGAYALRLDRETERLARHRRIAPLTEPGDLVLMDFLLLHQSGENLSDRPRWSMQFRWFNFAEPTGVRIGWRGSFAAGVDFGAVLPELVAAGEPAPGDGV